MTKKIVSLILIVFLIFNTSGFEFIFNIILNEYKCEAAEYLNTISEADLIVIKVTKNSADKIIEIDNNEISCNGERYDIYKIKNNKDTIFYYVFKDEREQNLISIFFGNGNQKSMNGKPDAKRPSNNLEKIYLHPQKILLCKLIRYNNFNSIISFLYKEPSKEINPQPPQV